MGMKSFERIYGHITKVGNFVRHEGQVKRVEHFDSDLNLIITLANMDGVTGKFRIVDFSEETITAFEPITEKREIETYNLLFKTAEKKRMDKQQDKEQLLEEQFEEMCSPALSNLLTEKGSIILFNNIPHRIKQSIRPSHDGSFYTVVLETKGGVSSFGVDIRKEIINSFGVIDKPELYNEWVTQFKQADVFEDAEPPVTVIPNELKERLSKEGSYVIYKNDTCVVHRAIRKYFDTKVDCVVLVRGHDGMHITVPLVDKTIVDFNRLDRLPFLPNGGIIPDASITLDFHIAANPWDDEEFKGYFRNALRLLDVQVDNPRVLETIIRAYEGIKQKGGEFRLSDASEIFAALVRKYPEEVIMPSPAEKPEPLPEITPDYTPAPIKLPNSKT
jgi:hypothetical protein